MLHRMTLEDAIEIQATVGEDAMMTRRLSTAQLDSIPTSRLQFRLAIEHLNRMNTCTLPKKASLRSTFGVFK
jgi:hypothetical protein